MRLSILGSGGCMSIPKPLCFCRVCKEARIKGPPYERTGPSAFLHDAHMLIDTPADVLRQLNNAKIQRLDSLMLTHLDPDHFEGFRVVEQLSIDFRTWRAFPEKQIRLLLPELLYERLKKVKTVYGPVIEFYEDQGFVQAKPFNGTIKIGPLKITAIPVDRDVQLAYIYVFEKNNYKIIYAPCDVKPFPENRPEVQKADLLVIQPGIFENGLKYGFTYIDNHISRQTLYTFDETIDLSRRLQAKEVLFIHLEEYWNRSYTDYQMIEKNYRNIRFAYDGMQIHLK
jgi:phosphoribosyl 1,2-cyclic phosphate phosphodiesterase